MILMRPELAAELDRPDTLHTALQTAIELEHATIPVYLYALYSLEPGRNAIVADMLRSVVLEEMTHMGLAANLLNAVGGSPVIARPGFVPAYPGPLPGTVGGDLEARLDRLSLDLVENVFMRIEEPEDPLVFRSESAAEIGPLTIGEFYAAIADQLRTVGSAAFVGDPARQVTHELGQEGLIAIADVDSALAAIHTIVEEGEGTQQSPLDREGELAHYYRFAEIKHGHRLVPIPDAPPEAPPDQLFSYTGSTVEIEAAGVRALRRDPRLHPYSTGSAADLANQTFNYTYSAVLKGLHATFNGRPDHFLRTVGLMESAKQIALEMGRLPADPSQPNGDRAGPSFAWQPVLTGSG
jgi:rubrerythrin